MDPLQWMGAVRIKFKVKQLVKQNNITQVMIGVYFYLDSDKMSFSLEKAILWK